MSGHEKLTQISDQLKKGQPTNMVTVATLLEWFGKQKRTKHNKAFIDDALSKCKIKTTPNYKNTWKHGEIEFVLEDEGDKYISSGEHDKPYIISMLEIANNPPKYVRPQDSFNTAITIMMINNYSQLPVMKGDRDVVGIISWRGIGRRLALNFKGKEVKDFVDPYVAVKDSESIFSIVSDVAENGCVLVLDKTNLVSGIITQSDLNGILDIISKPFVLLEEIEIYVRRILKDKFNLSDLTKYLDKGSKVQVKLIDDLTLGQYIRILEAPEMWKKLNLPLDRARFVRWLDNIRKIRNSVMHFHPEGIDEKELDQLQKFHSFLREAGTYKLF